MKNKKTFIFSVMLLMAMFFISTLSAQSLRFGFYKSNTPNDNRIVSLNSDNTFIMYHPNGGRNDGRYIITGNTMAWNHSDGSSQSLNIINE